MKVAAQSMRGGINNNRFGLYAENTVNEIFKTVCRAVDNNKGCY